VTSDDLDAMVAPLRRRGPDGAGTWISDSVGLGFTLLDTTPESSSHSMPLVHEPSGCALVADARLDNRVDLLRCCGLADVASTTSDAALVLTAYLKWGEQCVDHLRGDFAFALWDPRIAKLVCARDQMGMRPLFVHHRPGRLVAVASEPAALLALPGVERQIDERRIGDLLVHGLEFADATSTFWLEVSRVPPRTILSVTSAAVREREYWHLEPGEPLKLPDDASYAEALLDVLTKAVDRRLRSTRPVASMLSGGIDSNAVVGIARRLLAEQGAGPLNTFSVVSPRGPDEPETRAILTAAAGEGLDPHFIDASLLDGRRDELAELARDLDDPFDLSMNLVRAVYLAGANSGANVMLDGVGGDIIFDHGSYELRLIRQGSIVRSVRETHAQLAYWGDRFRWRSVAVANLRTAVVPESLRQRLRHGVHQRKLQDLIDASVIDRSFARRIGLLERLNTTRLASPARLQPTLAAERAQLITSRPLLVGRERYDRVAARFGIEPRDPYLDLDVIELSVRLPGDQLLAAGWPKAVLRNAMAGLVPDAVRWSPGKPHLGWETTSTLLARGGLPSASQVRALAEHVGGYVDLDLLVGRLSDGDPRIRGDALERWLTIEALATFIARNSSAK
jgi:asparagine synthase (glutamine-hydrolysing)